MKTTIDIPKEDLEDAMRFLTAKSKKEAVVTALREMDAGITTLQIGGVRWDRQIGVS